MVFMLGLLLAGCDQFSELDVRSEFSRPVSVILIYHNGEISKHGRLPCETFSLGTYKSGSAGFSKDISIREIAIEQYGKVIHRFEKAAIDKLVKKTEEDHYSVWVLNSSGISLSNEKKCSLKIQEEVDANIGSIGATSAGSALSK